MHHLDNHKRCLSDTLKELVKRGLSYLHTVMPVDHSLRTGISPLIRYRAFASLKRGELLVALLLRRALAKAQLMIISGCKVYECLCPWLTQSLVYAKGLVDAMRIPIRHAHQHDTKHSRVLDGLRGPLDKMRQGWMACVADEGDGAVDPCRQRSVDAEFHSRTSWSGTRFNKCLTLGQKSA
jgi:hypothetical protein